MSTIQGAKTEGNVSANAASGTMPIGSIPYDWSNLPVRPRNSAPVLAQMYVRTWFEAGPETTMVRNQTRRHRIRTTSGPAMSRFLDFTAANEVDRGPGTTAEPWPIGQVPAAWSLCVNLSDTTPLVECTGDLAYLQQLIGLQFEFVTESPVRVPQLGNAKTSARIQVTPDAERFLAQHKELYDLTREAMVKLCGYFPGMPLRAELCTHEIVYEGKELVISVLTQLPLSEALARLEQFDDEWWLDAISRSDGLVTITIKRQ